MASESAPGDATTEVVDPVCGEMFPPDMAVFTSTHEGRKVFFCSSTCKETFDADPPSQAPSA